MEIDNDAPSLPEMIQKVLARIPTERAIQFSDCWFDWGWIRQVADRVNGLLDEAGLEPNATVAIAAANRPALAAVLLGLIARERDLVMLYAYQSPEALARKVADLKCSAVLAAPDLWEEPMRRAVIETGSLAIAVDEETQAVVAGSSFNAALKHRPSHAPHGIALLTSGTTGPPKSHHLDYGVLRRSFVTESTVHPYGSPVTTLAPALHSSPFGNIAGLFGWLPLVVAGRPIILLEKFSLDEWLRYLREWRPVATGLPAPSYRVVLDANIPPEELEGVQYMICGAAPLDLTVQREFEEKYRVKILRAYGATEFGGVVAAMTQELRAEFPDKLASVGRPWAGAQIRVVDPVTREILPPTGEGALEVSVPRLGPQWIATTDLAMIDEDGFLYHRGRTDGAIMRGGFKINPDVVRAALVEHAAIADAVVTGVPDRRLGEVPVAAFKTWENAQAPTVDELQAHMRSRLPATFLPTRYRQVDTLPLTTTNKLDLGAVRAMFAAQDEPQSSSLAGRTV